MPDNYNDVNLLIAKHIYDVKNVYNVLCRRCPYGYFPEIILKNKDRSNSFNYHAQLTDLIKIEDYYLKYLKKDFSLIEDEILFLKESLSYNGYYAGSFQILPDYISNENNFNDLINFINNNDDIENIKYNIYDKSVFNKNTDFKYRLIKKYLCNFLKKSI